MLRSWVGRLGGCGGEIFTEFEPEPFSSQVLTGAGLVLHNGAQTFEIVAESEVVRAEPEGVSNGFFGSLGDQTLDSGVGLRQRMTFIASNVHWAQPSFFNG